MNQLKTLLKGVGQVMLQNSAITGLLFLVGIFWNSTVMGFGAVLGLLSATLAAVLFKYKKEDINNGLYGFNGVLVGIALLFYFEPSPIIFTSIVLGAILSTFIMNFMMKKSWSPYTFPFVLSTWIFMATIKFFHFAYLSMAGGEINSNSVNWLQATSFGFGQVMFQGSIITGIIFLIAILINSRINAAYAVLGSVVGILFALLLSLPLSLINLGIFGYNGVLCGIALGGRTEKSFVWAILGIILSCVILVLFSWFNFVALTAPFVWATWITLYFKKLTK